MSDINDAWKDGWVDLLPCPFCGGKAKLYADGVTQIQCTECRIWFSNSERSMMLLTFQWNRRTQGEHK